jgi:hypothetical protein
MRVNVIRYNNINIPHGQEEVMTRPRFSASMTTVAAAAAVVGASMSASMTRTLAQAPAIKPPSGDLDLQGIWADETDTPQRRSPKYANQEVFTPAQRDELDKERRIEGNYGLPGLMRGERSEEFAFAEGPRSSPGDKRQCYGFCRRRR